MSINDHYFFGDTLLTVTNTYSYLDMLLSDRGKFDVLQKNIANCSTRALFKFFKDLHHLQNPKIHFQCELFNKIIIPICDYGCKVWGFHKTPAIERVHLQFCKRILHVKKSTAIFFVYGELGRFPLAVNRYLKIIKYWLKIIYIITGKTNSVVYNLNRYQYETCKLEHANNWASKVKEMLNNLGFNYAWINQNVHNTFSFFKLCNQRLKDQYIS